MDEVKYGGISTVRSISKDEWEAAGVKDQEGTVWDASNGYSLPLSDFNDAALDVLAADGFFEVPGKESAEPDTSEDTKVVNVDSHQAIVHPTPSPTKRRA